MSVNVCVSSKSNRAQEKMSKFFRFKQNVGQTLPKFIAFSQISKKKQQSDLLGLRVTLFAVHEEASYSRLGPRKKIRYLLQQKLIVLILLTLKTKSPSTVYRHNLVDNSRTQQRKTTVELEAFQTSCI